MILKKKLRLLVTPECNRNCKGCCNKNFDLETLPICNDYSGYDEIMLTGGEPMLEFASLPILIHEIRRQNNKTKIILYTAHTRMPGILTSLVKNYLDGITLTLHTIQDIVPFAVFNYILEDNCSTIYFDSLGGTLHDKSLRLNVFKQVRLRAHGIKHNYLPFWRVKDDMEWIKDCPLPEDEVFMRVSK